MEESAVQRLGSTAIVPVTAAALFFLALAPAWLRAHGDTIFALAIVAFFSKLCHQRADRTLFLLGAPAAVCLRCLGIYAGAAFGSLLRLSRTTALRWLGAALSLNVIDVAAESIGLHGNLPLLRLLIGTALGIAVGAMLSVELPSANSLARPGRQPYPR
jgi:uncharacterized membrane protein